MELQSDCRPEGAGFATVVPDLEAASSSSGRIESLARSKSSVSRLFIRLPGPSSYRLGLPAAVEN